ncbi:plasmid replication protein RepC [uncultured Rhodoblastus sp.]|uniref:plasmid replication protein RepC n=1 Tax=uncultured Rhodoblastus sp. TaxID=543037 RepID=UPI0025F5291F|nr:plasmid replication protein RepC [uncultured Rhodoblastus sp.]
MEPIYPTTPFGRRTLSLAQVAHQMVANQRPQEAVAHKWKVYHDIRTAAFRLCLSDRALSILSELLAFHPEVALTGDNLIVFPSNEQIALRAGRMPMSTMRRHLALLVNAGIILRRDSPNGKRYVRKGREGATGQAFGFDLSPLVARAAEFKELARAVLAEEQELRDARSDFSILRREIVKSIATGKEEGIRPPEAGQGALTWQDVQTTFEAIVARKPPKATLGEIQPILDELAALCASLRKAIEDHLEPTIMGANGAYNEQHIQNSNPKARIDLEPAPQEDRADEIVANPEPRRPAEVVFPLGMVLQACPDIADYARGGEIAHWRDLLSAASLARAALGISPSAWEAAQAVMGQKPAAIVIAAILQRGATITSAGGYLRQLTRKAELNEFSVGPMLMALIGAKNRAKKSA